ncbi:MAG: hypothetical protein SWH61_10055 [Thermodesulfobacteriota bacterium]|nr:hypothetical protein [Thermodesulfobacteriota bacterium]
MLRFLLVLFFISGAIGLGYQVLWSKVLLKTIGISAYSYAIVLACFMAGLAIGGRVLGPLADKTRNPLRLFGFYEALIGLYALFFIPLADIAYNFYYHHVTYTPFNAGETSAIIYKLGVSAVLLLIPTFFMGGTLPALVRHCCPSYSVAGKKSATLYGINAAGAVTGILGCAFLIIPFMGIQGTFFLLAIGNLFVALGAFILSVFYHPENEGPEKPADNPIQWETSKAGHALYKPEVMVLVFSVGLISFIYETAWTRYYALMLGSSTYSFAIMLAASITGIASGNYWLSHRKDYIKKPVIFWGKILIASALYLLVTWFFYPFVPVVFTFYNTLFSCSSLSFYIHEAGKLLFCFSMMLPVSFCLGMTIPLIIHAHSNETATIGSDTGKVFAWNTWGNVAGALTGGLLFLTLFGLEKLFLVAGLLQLLAGFYILFRNHSRITVKKWLHSGPVLILLALLSTTFYTWDKRYFTLEPARRKTNLSMEMLRKHLHDTRVHLFIEDASANIMVCSFDKSNYFLYLNGKVDASLDADLPTQILVGQLPLIFHKNPRNVCVIGLASGITTGSMLLDHRVQRVDTVEIISRMPEATVLFDSWNHGVLKNERCNLIVDDARNYLIGTEQQYDIIVSEPSNPWMSGVASLFTLDFYRTVKSRLTSQGLFVQWLQAYEISNETFFSIIRALRDIFPYVYGFQGASGDLLLLSSREPLNADFFAMREYFRQPRIKAEMERADLHSLVELLALQKFSPATIDLMAAHSQYVNTDNNLFVETRAPIDLFTKRKPTLTTKLDERLIWAPSLFINSFLKTYQPSWTLKDFMAVNTRKNLSNPYIEREILAAFLQSPDTDISPSIPHADEMSVLKRDDLILKIDTLIANRKSDELGRLLRKYLSPIVLQSAFSSENQVLWNTRIDNWISAAEQDGAIVNHLHALKIHLLLVQADRHNFRKGMESWLNRGLSVSPELALRLSGLIDRAYRKQLLKRYLAAPHPLWMERLFYLSPPPLSTP